MESREFADIVAPRRNELYTSSVTVTGTWSDGRSQPRASRVIRKSLTPSLQRARHPDVIEPSAAIGQRPVGGAVAPPRIDLFRQRDAFARDVDPFAVGLRRQQLLAFDRGVRHDFQQLPVRPHVVLMRRHVEIADQDMAVVAARMQRLARLHLVEKLQLVLEFRIERGIRNIAAGRNVEIMQHQRL